MAIGSFRGQLESTISKRMGATDDPYKARRTSAQADYQAQASKAREDLSERLNRLGVLRGAGATASQFGEFESGVLRGQQAIGAQFEAQREAGIGQALQQGLGLYGTTEQVGLAGRQQTETERMGQFSRDLGTREFMSQDALRRDQQREAERSALAQEGMQAGALTGIYGQQRTLGQQQQDLAYRVGIGGLTGRDVAGGGGQTEAARATTEREAIARAEITGRYGAEDEATLARQELIGIGEGTETTLAAQELALRKGQALGKIGADETLAAELGRGALTEQTAGREQLATEGLAGRDLQATIAQGQFNQQTQERLQRERMQTAQFGEAQLGREFAGGEGLAERDLRATMAQAQINAQTQERAQRERMQTAEFGQQATQADLQRDLAREEIYGRTTTEYERAMGGVTTLGARGQAAGITAENRRLAEMEAAGASQREIADESARMREAELMGYTEDESGRRQQTLGAREAQAQRGLEGRRLTEMESAGLSQRQIALRAMTEAETAGLSQRGLAERELTQRSSLASQQRELEREQLYGRAMTRDEQMSGLGYTGGTLGAQGLAQEAEQAELQRGLAREEMFGYREVAGGREQTLGALEAGRERGLRQQEITQRETLQAADITARRREGQEGRLLAREELYGTGDVRAQRGGTLASREVAQRGRLAGEEITSREGMAAEQRRLGREELYGTAQRTYGEESIASRQAREDQALRSEDLALRGELGRGQLGRETRRLDIAEAEMYGEGQMGQTLAARESAAQRGLEGRRLTEMETAGQAGRFQEGRRTDLAQAEVYGTGRGGQTLAAREAESARGERALDRAVDTRRADLAEQELYGYREGPGGYREGTLAAQEAGRGRGERAGVRETEETRYQEGLALDEARVTGQYKDQDTMAREFAGVEQRQRDRGLRLQEEDLYGGKLSPQEQYEQGTLSRSELDDRWSARQFEQEGSILDRKLRAIALRQTRPEGYDPLITGVDDPETADIDERQFLEDEILAEMLEVTPGEFRAGGRSSARPGRIRR